MVSDTPETTAAPPEQRPAAGVSLVRLKQIPGKALKQGALVTLSILTIFPLYFMFVSAFKTRDEFIENLLGLPGSPTLQNFRAVLAHPNLLTWFLNSLVLTGGSVLITTALSILAAFSFARMRFRGRDLLFAITPPLMVIPPIVMIIPQFVMLNEFGLVNQLAGPLLIYAGLMLPFTIYLLRNFFITIPREIHEAALIDGASTWQILSRIDLPLARPAVVTSMLVNVVWVWNELLIALVFLQRDELRTLVVGIATSLQKRFTLDVPALMAGLAVATIPMIILYAVGQRTLVRGLTAGFEK
ncbi:MAG: carbohydrate ABC transporter permease [Chloroflexi bacterium]|mgnify:CR=1 FL=1|jgi:ABC-type glycerol-3-phosphate transport system permease component|nr:carbohydrate ABC transporter permease [Chloroflexota bacterium]